MTFCHRRECRKTSGGPYIAFVAMHTKSLKWQTSPDIYKSSDIAERGFCSVCGSCLSMQYYLQSNRMGVTANSIDEIKEKLDDWKMAEKK